MLATMYLRSLRATVLCAGLVLVIAARVSAGPLNLSQLPTITVQAGDAQSVWTWTPSIDSFFATSDGYQLRNARQQTGVCDGLADVKVDLRFNPDPFVLNNLLVTNTTAITQPFSVTVAMPTSFGAPNNIRGTITTSVIEGGTDTATVATQTGVPIYRAQIDTVTVATMQNDPFSVTTNQSTASSATFGPTASAVPVVTNIGIQINFTLTAGDSASILSRFDVTDVPEPLSAAVCVGTMLVLTAMYSRCGRRNA